MTARLTIGPILYFWSAEKKHDFYARIADEAPVDTVYIGETICSKRQPFFDDQLPDVAERLTRAGKQVVFCGLAEVMLKRERKASEALADFDLYEIEVNNAAGLYHLNGRAHRVGPFMNVYNEGTMAWLAGKGATHVSLPTELPGKSVAVMAKAAKDLGLGLEVQVFGRAGLATSARCYHARAWGRTKDNCQFICEEDADGMPLNTRSGESFLRVNGIQTLSESYVNLASEVPAMIDMGVSDLRIMPQEADMVAVSGTFAALSAAQIDTTEANAQLDALELSAPFSNGFWHSEAGYKRIDARARAIS